MCETLKIYIKPEGNGKYLYSVESKPTENSTTIEKVHTLTEEKRPFILNKLLKTTVLEENQVEAKSGGYPILLMIHSVEEVECGQTRMFEDTPFGQDELADKSDNVDTPQTPIIHISLSDLFVDSLYGVDPLPRDIPRYYMVMDNSIWNYLVPMHDTYYIHNLSKYSHLKPTEREKEKKDILTPKKNFIRAIQSICRNYEKGLYYLKVAKEYADLNARIARDNFLSGAHASGVSPFIFHSEGAIRQMINREFRSTKNDIPEQNEKYVKDSPIDRILKRKWRILLLDDKANTAMDTDGNNNGKKLHEGWNNKCTIISNILEQQLGETARIDCRPCAEELLSNNTETESTTSNKDNNIVIEYAQSLAVAKEALKKRQYDLLLLDYLLNEADESTHYGYELLEDIYKDQELEQLEQKEYKYIRPDKHHRLYCMFISAYSSAVNDRLLAEGLNQSEKYWFINTGACPTNTPQLFLYNLLKLMDKRLDDCGIPDLTTRGIFNLMSTIFNVNVRKNSADYYHEVLELQHYFRGRMSAVTKYNANDPFETDGSVLMSDFIQKNGNLGGLLEHMGQLVHLAAYGTIRQWPEMWEEYVYFRSQFDEQNLQSPIDDNSELNKLYRGIEAHISNLKKDDR